jgi:nucleoside-diphosphate-sugar epimerase
MRVLVTGGGGFLGQALVRRLLERGDSARVFARGDYPALRALGAEVLRGDVGDASAVDVAVAGCDAVIHTAARVGSWGRYRDFHQTNVVGTENVLAACLVHRVSRLVYTSSPSVAHGSGDVEGIDESHPRPTRFDAHYPRTKAIAEQKVLAANGPTFATVALRPHLLWGPGDTQLLPRAIESARAGRFRFPSGPPKRMDCTFIDNAVDAHLLALDRLAPGAPCAGRAYFISQGEPLPFTELVERVFTAAGVTAPRKTVSPWVLYGAGCVAELAYALLGIRDREPPVTRFVARQLTTAHWFDIRAARRDLGYVPRVSMEEGLRRLAAEQRPVEVGLAGSSRSGHALAE